MVFCAVDCVTGSLGCSGGWIDRTIAWVINNGGLNSESSYPYTAVQGTCRASSNNVATVTSYEAVAIGDEDDLLVKASKGPVAVGIAASGSGFQLYQSGVYSDASCTAAGIDHAVALIGWGTENGTPYWLIKNQWGTSKPYSL